MGQWRQELGAAGAEPPPYGGVAGSTQRSGRGGHAELPLRSAIIIVYKITAA